MLRSFVASAVIVLIFGTTGWGQTPSATTTPISPAPAKTIAKKPAAKAKPGAKQPAVVETGPCRLGVISALGDRFSVQKFGLTIFETEESEIPVEGWGFDDLAMARVRAVTGAVPSVRRITYPKGAFEPFYNPKSRFLPDPNEGLPAIVRNITSNTNCERYLVFTKYDGQVSGTKLTIKGIGAYNQGLGSLFRHSHLFANVAINLIDGSTYETISRRLFLLSTGVPIAEYSLTELDNSLFPDPPESASGNATLRERTRALISTKLDRLIPGYLQE
jgi:hypothetical protein